MLRHRNRQGSTVADAPISFGRNRPGQTVLLLTCSLTSHLRGFHKKADVES